MEIILLEESNMNKQIILNHFLSAIIMGQEIFLIYKDKAQDEKLKNKIGRAHV